MTAIKINKTTPKKLSQISEPDKDELHFKRGFPLIGCNWRGLKALGRMLTHEEKKRVKSSHSWFKEGCTMGTILTEKMTRETERKVLSLLY